MRVPGFSPLFCLASCILFAGIGGSAQEQSWSARMASTVIHRWPQGINPPSAGPHVWNYQLGFLLQAMEATKNNASSTYVRAVIDPYITPNGTIPAYDSQEQSMDNFLLGRQVLLRYRQTGDVKYKRAAEYIRGQIATHPRNASGGLWHKRASPNQMLLDDAYMLAPFLSEYAKAFNEPEDYSDITLQFVLLEDHTRDAKSGLLYQEWNEPKKERWVSQSTGTSASFWGRGTGWYLMALVDSLPYYPEAGPDRQKLIEILNRTADGIARHQDRQSGLWYQVLDKPGATGNYLESSASAMFVYGIAKGVRLGYLPPSYLAVAKKGWNGILHRFVQSHADGTLSITSTCQSIDLGSAPSHDGSYTYYTTAPVVSDDPKGVAAFLLAATEMEALRPETGSEQEQKTP